MRPRLPANQRGVTLLELLVVMGVAGALILVGMASFYVAVVRAFNESTSQASLQRVGALALQAITSRAQMSSAITLNPSPACAPAGTTGRSLRLSVTDTAPLSLPTTQLGTYCYYAGNGANGAGAGALCQRFTPVSTGTPGACRDLLAAPHVGLVRKTGQTAGVVLIKQTTPVSPFCPQNTLATDASGTVLAAAGPIAVNVYCLDVAQVSPPVGEAGNTTGNFAFGITDGVSQMTFTATLMQRN